MRDYHEAAYANTSSIGLMSWEQPHSWQSGDLGTHADFWDGHVIDETAMSLNADGIRGFHPMPTLRVGNSEIDQLGTLGSRACLGNPKCG
jgi:hypothetical protein